MFLFGPNLAHKMLDVFWRFVLVILFSSLAMFVASGAYSNGFSVQAVFKGLVTLVLVLFCLDVFRGAPIYSFGAYLKWKG